MYKINSRQKMIIHFVWAVLSFNITMMKIIQKSFRYVFETQSLDYSKTFLFLTFANKTALQNMFDDVIICDHKVCVLINKSLNFNF